MKEAKRILGLDLGTNSIGWALIEHDFKEKSGTILGAGSRIIPMSQDIIGEFEKGNSISQTAERTRLRSTRRLKERHLLRRERLHRVLNVLNFLPTNYAANIDFEKRRGKFLPETETKLAYDNERQFIFKKSFDEMLIEFQQYQPSLTANGRKIPYDWTIYYLRKKALTQKIENEELAWLLLHFNQKRGYYQLRGEEGEDKKNKVEEFYSLKIVDVIADEARANKNETWYSITLENGWIYRRSSKVPLYDWRGNVRDFIITTELNEDGSIKKDKEGKEKRSFRSPQEGDWQLLKKKTEADIDKTDKTVGAYIYDSLLQNPNQKIKGKLVRTIERNYYKVELIKILEKQIELNATLQERGIYEKCVEELYPHNLQHQSALKKKDFLHLFVEDILYYQRPLRSQKSSISDCPLEYRTFILDGVKQTTTLKCIPKSHPLFQEFRLWQWISNLRFFNRSTDVDETEFFLQSEDSVTDLFDFLSEKKGIDQKTLLKYFNKKESQYRWNYVEDKEYPCNETHTMIAGRYGKIANAESGFLSKKKEEELWHIIYSVTDKVDYEKALRSFAAKNNLPTDGFVEAFKKFPPFPSNYGSYSAKAIKKLLPLMRRGKYWNAKDIDGKTRSRIDKIISGEYDENIQDRVRDKAIKLTDVENFCGLPEWLAKYVVYDRHAERSSNGKWETLADVDKYINSFKQHSLKNPIVEQVVNETLRVVKEIWKHYGKGAANFFDEIHVELGREMKNPTEKRKQLTEQISKNENTNLRIKALLMEMGNDDSVENVRPYSPMQQEILKIYEDGALSNNDDIPEEIAKISKMSQPSTSELHRYKLWLEQKYRSPYTGEIIPLNKLFTPAYEIEHIIPQSRYFDDSLSNKVICESAVNKLKDNQTGLEFIENHHGQVVSLGFGRNAKIFSKEEYTDFVKQHYAQSYTKRNKLLAADIPEKMIERQLNDTRYISRFTMQLLSNIVRADKDDDGINSKNVIASNGQITAKLKRDWGLEAIWNDLILPRFERLNQIAGKTIFTVYNEKYQRLLPAVPLELQKGFQKKRIDHRHHALDAIVIACATRSHINFLNNQNAVDKKRSKEEKQKERHDLKIILCDKKYNSTSKDDYSWTFKAPWSNFTTDAKNILKKIIVSFKQNLRVINKTVNYSEKYKNGKKELEKQKSKNNWAIRKSLHKDTVSGLVYLRKTKPVSLSVALDNIQSIADTTIRRQIKILTEQGYDKKKLIKYIKDNNNQLEGKDVSKVDVFFMEENVASRTIVDASFTEKRIAESITDTGIQKILLKHLQEKDANPELAFSPEGVEEMNKNIVRLNGGIHHQPIYKVRTYEPKGNKFIVGHNDNKKHKYVEADKGTNLYFAVYVDDANRRSYTTVPLNIVIQRLKEGLTPVPSENEKGHTLAFYLSPNDLVYIPDMDEQQMPKVTIPDQLDSRHAARIYKVVSFTGGRLYCIPHAIATSIVDKVEFTQLNKLEFTLDKLSIKEHCVKLLTDRLGHTRISPSGIHPKPVAEIKPLLLESLKQKR